MQAPLISFNDIMKTSKYISKTGQQSATRLLLYETYRYRARCRQKHTNKQQYTAKFEIP